MGVSLFVALSPFDDQVWVNIIKIRLGGKKQ